MAGLLLRGEGGIRVISVWRVLYRGLLSERSLVGVLLRAFIRAISVRRVFYWVLLLERSQYGGSFTSGFY